MILNSGSPYPYPIITNLFGQRQSLCFRLGLHQSRGQRVAFRDTGLQFRVQHRDLCENI